MGIKLRTDQAKLIGDVPWWKVVGGNGATLHALAHDAAVAHALMRAIGELDTWVKGRGAYPDYPEEWIPIRAAEILRDDFGIEE